jgi:hypothetical protein
MSNMAWLAVALIAIVVVAYLAWDYIKPIFKDSEVLFFGRLQALVGVAMATNFAPIIPSKWLPYYIIASGIITELARRNRATDL